LDNIKEVEVGGKLFKILNNIPPEYQALVDALSNFYYACGSQKLCGACFAGKLEAYYDDGKKRIDPQWRRKGCCGYCPNLSSTGCVQKPVGCASYNCSMLNQLLPARLKGYRIARVASRAFHWGHPGAGCYSRELAKVSEHNYTPEALRQMRASADTINRWTRWIKMTGWKPDWEKMQEITRAEPGTFVEIVSSHPAGTSQGGKEVNMATPKKKTLKSKKSTRKTYGK